MKNLLLYSALAAIFVIGGLAPAEARDRDRRGKREHYSKHTYDRGKHHHPTKRLFIIENRRPVERVVYVDPTGGYYRIIDGRRVYVRERYYETYPDRYYYPDGRRRFGLSFFFGR